MSPETLTLIAGAALSLLFAYFPGLNTWFAAKSSDVKRLIMAGVRLVAWLLALLAGLRRK